MTDFRALCAELVQAWDSAAGIDDLLDLADVADKARAALAQEQQGATVVELTECDYPGPLYSTDHTGETSAWPEEEEDEEDQQGAPTDEELLRLGCKSIDYEYSAKLADDVFHDTEYETLGVFGSELIAFARAVLKRWGGRG